MKKYLVLTCCAALLMTGCGTYAGAGAYAGSGIGGMLGSAIGGIAGGWRGSDIGTVVGMAGGAIVGGAIGSAADQKRDSNRAQRMERSHSYDRGYEKGYERGYDQGYDDRIYDFGSSDYTGNYSAAPARVTTPSSSSYRGNSNYGYNQKIEVRNARFVDDNHDQVLRSNEVSKIIFEVVNNGDHTLYDLQPQVIETTGNKRIYISPSVHVEKLAPGQAIRYTAMVKAGKLKDGTATFCISVLQGGREMSGVSEFTVSTRR